MKINNHYLEIMNFQNKILFYLFYFYFSGYVMIVIK
jgi:hypothetical protein